MLKVEGKEEGSGGLGWRPRRKWPDIMCESFFDTLECGMLDRPRFETEAEARNLAFEFIKAR